MGALVQMDSRSKSRPAMLRARVLGAIPVPTEDLPCRWELKLECGHSVHLNSILEPHRRTALCGKEHVPPEPEPEPEPKPRPKREKPMPKVKEAKRFKVVKFVQPYGRYRPGRLALLRDWFAEELVKDGVAVRVNMQIEGTVIG